MHDGRAGVVQHDAVHVDDLEVLHAAVHFQQRHGLLHIFFGGFPELVVAQAVGKRVEINAARHFFFIKVVGFNIADEAFHQVQVAFHVVELHAGGVQVDVFEQRFQSRVTVDVGGVESHAGGAALQGVRCNSVGLGGIGLFHFLNNIPVVVTGFRATRIGELVRHGLEIVQVLQIFSALIGAYLETFIGSPYEFLLVISAFEVFIDGGFPLFRGHGWEFGE